jgi:hypothetical protein
LSSQESIGWDPIYIYHHFNAVTQIYTPFVLAALVVAVVRLIHLWITAPPFCLRRKIQDRDYLNRLRQWRSSTRQWTGCAILGWALVISSDLYTFGTRIIESKTIVAVLLVYDIQEIGASSCFAALSCLLLFLTQWHMLSRIQHLQAYAAPGQSAD